MEDWGEPGTVQRLYMEGKDKRWIDVTLFFDASASTPSEEGDQVSSRDPPPAPETPSPTPSSEGGRVSPPTLGSSSSKKKKQSTETDFLIAFFVVLCILLLILGCLCGYLAQRLRKKKKLPPAEVLGREIEFAEVDVVHDGHHAHHAHHAPVVDDDVAAKLRDAAYLENPFEDSKDGTSEDLEGAVEKEASTV